VLIFTDINHTGGIVCSIDLYRCRLYMLQVLFYSVSCPHRRPYI